MEWRGVGGEAEVAAVCQPDSEELPEAVEEAQAALMEPLLLRAEKDKSERYQ